jgi:CheY-like chemotaxis protein
VVRRWDEDVAHRNGTGCVHHRALRRRPDRALNIVVADDDVLLREGLASPLDRPGFKVAGQAADATEVLSLVGEHRPDLVVVDIYS